MAKVRTAPLTDQEITCFNERGYLYPIRVVGLQQAARLAEAVEDHLSGRVESQAYELTDPIPIRRIKSANQKTKFEYEDFEQSKPHTFPFLFNLWKRDERFKSVALDPIIAGMARQLLGSKEVVLMEDNVVVKNANSKAIPWHQDYSYWPLESPSAVTVWIALDPVTPANGAMQIVPGSHERGEKLPVAFRDASSFMHEDRPGIAAISQNPQADGEAVITYTLEAGECGFHHSLVWHASTPNATLHHRRVLVLRYVAGGTVWLGNERFPYDEVGLSIGDPIGGPHFPTVETAF